MDYLDSRGSEFPETLDTGIVSRPRAKRRPAIRLTRDFEAAPERVFNAWLDPRIASRWLFATAWRPMTPARLDARVGGTFRFIERYRLEHSGAYVLIVPPRRLVFTLSSTDRRPDSQVAVEVLPRKGGCRLTLNHAGVPQDEMAQTENRWTGMLYGLATLVSS